MAIVTLTNENFDATVKEGTVLVDFWATWCGPCRMQAPILEQLDAKLDGAVTIGKVDVDEQPELANRFGVSSIPTLVIMKNGEVAEKKVGVTDAATLEALVK